ncbi:MAG TPA: CPBP family intramembrane metalloprotease, partial [Firmicutes bacterium]|nr:CPBP family intramembrane metalloprotease [Bacillota bacterium]
MCYNNTGKEGEFMKKILAKNIWPIIVCLLISVVFFIYGIKNFGTAFSEAAIDFKLTREEIKAKANEFLALNGYQTGDEYYNTISLSEDTIAKTFLDKEFGLEQLQKFNDNGYKVWYWEVRRFKPLTKEEFYVSLNTDGRLISFRHIYEEERSGANLSKEEALIIAEDFISSVQGLNLENLVLKEEKQIAQPNRTDYKFEWELKSFSVGEAPYRYLVRIQGDEVGEYDEYLKVPENWRRNFAKLRSQNSVYQTVSNIFFVILFIIIIINFIYRLVKRDLKLSLALKLGILVFLLQLLSQLNMYPLYLSGYDVNQSFSSFIIYFIMSGVVSGIIQGFMIFLAVASGETVYRQYFKEKIQIKELFKFKGFKLSETFYGSIWGYIMTMFHLGFVIMFYNISTNLGAWAPASTQYTEMVNTLIPWIFPLTIGVMASVSEEFIFRVFAIPFVKKITKSNFLAVVVPAFLWGFLHSNYPQQPGYIRGIEVGIIGVIAGIIMIRYGILATLIWHYAIDATLVGLFLFGTKNLYFIISGVIVIGVVFI